MDATIKMFAVNTLPIQILIADDDKVIADILKDFISNPERSVEVCYDGQDACDKIKEKLFDLIIVDLVMPYKGGLEVLKFARQLNPEVLVIIVTGYASLETAVMAIKEGAYDYIVKPCRLDEFRIVIERAIDKIKLHKENKNLLNKLEDAYLKLTAMDEISKDGKRKVASLNFFSSSKAGLHYLYNNNVNSNYAEKLKTLSDLKTNGTLTAEEFSLFKNYYLKMINIQD